MRHAPGSSFERPCHGGGEEILVLEGTFSDELGDYPAGSYLRNPAGSHSVRLCHLGLQLRSRPSWPEPKDFY